LAGGVFAGDDAKTRQVEESLFGTSEHASPLRILAADSPPVVAPGEVVPGERLGEKGLAEEWGRGGNAAVERRLHLQPTNPIGYLGYGPIVYTPRIGSQYLRPRIPEKTPLRLIIQRAEKTSPPADALELLGRAVWCWLHLGGIGARSRRGFGSLTVASRIDAKAFGPFPELFLPSVSEFRANAAKVLADARHSSKLAEWTHFTGATRIYVSQACYTSWEEALTAAGAWLIAFRRRYGIANDERGSGVANRDYQWLRAAAAEGIPDRAGFGLPLPFGRDESLVVAWGDARGSRRASPLLVHVSRFGANHRVVLTHIPARLVPRNKTLHFRGKSDGPNEKQEGIIGVFLKDLKDRKLVEPIL
jgi:hypothetical protein